MAYLKSELVFLFVRERNVLTDNVSEVGFHKIHSEREAFLYLISGGFIVIITKTENLVCLFVCLTKTFKDKELIEKFQHTHQWRF